jgi:hypothetical protein
MARVVNRAILKGICGPGDLKTAPLSTSVDTHINLQKTLSHSSSVRASKNTKKKIRSSTKKETKKGNPSQKRIKAPPKKVPKNGRVRTPKKE